MTERFFAPCPRGLEAALAAELARARRGGRRRRPTAASRSPATSRSPCARTSSRASRAASCGASAAARTATSAPSTTLVNGDRLEAAASPPTRTLRVDVAATRSPLQSLEFATLARQGRGVRPLSRRRQRAPVDRQARARRARQRLPHRPRRDDLPRHVGRAAVQARLPARHGRGAAAREPRGRARSRSPDGRPTRRCSIRCAAAGRSPSRRR